MSREPYIITADDMKDIVRRYKNDTDLLVIAELYDTTKKRIVEILKMLGEYEMPTMDKPATTGQGVRRRINVEKLKTDWNNGMAFASVVAKYGFSNGQRLSEYISIARKEGHNFKHRICAVSKEQRNRDLLADCESGMDWQEIATKYGYNSATSARCATNYIKKKVNGENIPEMV